MGNEPNISQILDQRIYNRRVEYLIIQEINPKLKRRSWVDQERMDELIIKRHNKFIFDQFITWFRVYRKNDKVPNFHYKQDWYPAMKEMMKNTNIPADYTYLHNHNSLEYSGILISIMDKALSSGTFNFNVGFDDDVINRTDRRIIELMTWEKLYNAWKNNVKYKICRSVLGSPYKNIYDSTNFSRRMKQGKLAKFTYTDTKSIAPQVLPYLGSIPIIVMICNSNLYVNNYWTAAIIKENLNIDHFVPHSVRFNCGYNNFQLYKLASELKIVDLATPRRRRIYTRITRAPLSEDKVSYEILQSRKKEELKDQRQLRIRREYGERKCIVDSLFITAEYVTKLLNES